MAQEPVSFNVVTLAIVALVGAAIGGFTTVSSYILYRVAREFGETEAPGARVGLPPPLLPGQTFPTPQEARQRLEELGLTPEQVLDQFFGRKG